MTNAASNDDLVNRIRQKRTQLEAFLGVARPRKRRLLNTTIVGGTLAAALTAGPAVGGPSFTAWLTAALGLTSPSWRVLCGAASVCSVLATVATQLLKSNNIEEHVTRAQGCRAKLEVLEAGLTLGQIDARQATTEYLKCVEDAAFLEGS
jgi:MFS family permease